ncbi:50S ribosomal protein L10 [Myxococcota bacterium]|nr:50S ribosomal protein L10 [Myxococcota bacterium]
MNRTDKDAFLAEYGEKFGRASIAILAEYSGLKVEALNGFRRLLDKTGGDAEFHIVKNTLCRRIVANTAMAGLESHFRGPTAVLFGYEDPVAPAKTILDFQKEAKSLGIKAAYFDGQVVNAEGVKAISQLPSKEALRGQLLGLLSAPARNMVSVLAQVPRQMLNVLDARRRQMEEGTEAAAS